MKLRYKDTTLELETPNSYSDLMLAVFEHFQLQEILATVKTADGNFAVCSKPDFEKFTASEITEIEVKDMAYSNLPILNSVDTCESHEKTDSDESKRSEIICGSGNRSFRKISDAVDEFRCQETQTDDVEVSEVGEECGMRNVDFQAQYDEPLVIELECLEEFIRKIFVDNKKVSRKNSFVHSGFACFKCGCTPIVGVRFECVECRYQLCENCEAKEHPHDLLVHKGTSKVQPVIPTAEDSLIKKISDLGLGDKEKIKLLCKKYQNDLNRIVEDLLFN